MLLLDEPALARRDVGVVRVTGPDRLAYLHTMLSQAFEDAAAGDCRDFLHLDAKGNPLAAGRAVVHDVAVLLAVPPEVAAELAAALEKFKFLTDVSAVDVSDDFALVSVRGPGSAAVAGAPSEPMTAAPQGEAEGDATRAAGFALRDRDGGVDLLGAPGWVEARADQLGLPIASGEEWEAWRITAGIPAWGREIVPGRRAQELGLLPTHVHLRKGCYPGQESIAKTYNLGRPRRALAVVRLDRPVEAGAPLEAGGKRGEVTSVAAVGGGAVALALLPVDRDRGEVAGDGGVSAGDVTGRVLRRVGAGLPQPGA